MVGHAKPWLGLPAEAVQIRLLEATLFQSLFFGDDYILVSQRIYGTGPDESPVLSLIRLAWKASACGLYTEMFGVHGMPLGRIV